MGVMIDIPMPEDCENCLICSLVPEHARLDLHEHGLQYRLYCKVTGACVSGKGRGKACPLHRCKTGKWIPVTRIEEWHQEEGLIGFPPEAREFPICTVKYVDATEPDEVDAVRCSECGAIFDFADARNWCSECGADMREGDPK